MITYQTDDLTVFQSRMFQLNSSVVHTDDVVMVVDPGYFPDEIEEIRQYVDSIKGDKPLYLSFTHSDYDHIVGYGAFPDAKTIASKAFVESPLKEKQMEDAIKYDDEFYITRPYKLEYPVIDIIVKDFLDLLEVGETKLSFFSAIGHNNDGLGIVIEPNNFLIAGDYLSDIEFPFVYESFDKYIETIKSLYFTYRLLDPLTLVPGHGSVTNDKVKILERLEDSKGYIKLVQKGPSEEDFENFMADKNYKFKTILRRRHQDNLKQFIKENK